MGIFRYGNIILHNIIPWWRSISKSYIPLMSIKMRFSIKDFFSKREQIRNFPADLVTFTEEIFNGKPHFLCSVMNIKMLQSDERQ